MRHWFFVLPAILFLAGCSTNKISATQAPLLGEVVNCDSVPRGVPSAGLKLPCLDDNSQIDLSSLKGPLIVNVWGSWCAPCKAEIPIFRSFYAKAKTQLEILGVDVEEARISEGVNFIIENGMSWPNVYDPDGRTRGYFGPGVPVTWFIGTDGTVLFKKIGEIASEEELIDLTSKYLDITVS